MNAKNIFIQIREAILRDQHRWHKEVGIDTETLSRGSGQFCPFVCGGNGTDRVHAAPSFNVDGAVRCRTEGKVYDAFDAFVAAGKAVDRLDAAKQLASLYGVQISTKRSDYYIPKLQLYNADLASPWLAAKGTTEAAFLAAGGSLIQYMGNLHIGIPAFAPSDFTRPVRWILYNRLGGPIKIKDSTAPSKCVRVTKDAPKALLGIGLGNIADVDVIIKVEGPTDALKLWDAIPMADKSRYAVISNANGCTENPTPESIELMRDKTIYIVGDADKPGQAGAAKWAKAFVPVATQVFIVELPYPIAETHGKDTRDYFSEGNTFDEFMQLAKTDYVTENEIGQEATQIITPLTSTIRISPTGKNVLDTNRTLPTAEAFVRDRYIIDGVRTIHFLNGEFYTWNNNAYRPVNTVVLRGEMLRFLDNAVTVRTMKNGDINYHQFPAQKTNVDKAMDALKGFTVLSPEIQIPHWLGTESPPVSDPSMIIFGKNRNIDIVTMQMFDPSPKWFNYNALDFNYDPDAVCKEWDKFLHQLWPDDVESRDTLMMFIGLLLVPITKLQKALFMVGPKRCGKGTIIQIAQHLVGKHNYCSPTTDDLGRQFGLQSFIGKTAAFVSDARFNNRDMSMITERILTITGEDEIMVDRKQLIDVTIRLLTRFVFVSNDVPRFPDASGALASRFIVLKMTNSFYGKEDLDLKNKLIEELPGILNQAITSLKSLLEQGYFKQPESASADVELMENLSSPVSHFVKECCNVGPGLFESSELLWNAWNEWCEAEGIRAIGVKEMFFRSLNALGIPNLAPSRPTDDSGKRVRGYSGIELKDGNEIDLWSRSR